MIKRVLMFGCLLMNSCYSFIKPSIYPLHKLNNNRLCFNNPCKELINYNRNIQTSILLKKNKNDFNIDLDDYKTYLFIFFIMCIIRNYVIVITTLKFINYY